MAADPARYEGAYSDESAYGSAVRLAGRSDARGLVLDLGCGFGPVAEPLTALGFTYVGLDAEAVGLTSLEARGFEVGEVDLEQPDEALQARLDQVLDGRSLALVLLLDVLEHLRNPEACLRAVTEVARRHPGAELVVSLPNVTHVDVIGKALLGRWDRTDIGLLDRTHVQLFGERDAIELATDIGWEPVDADDVEALFTEQCDPPDAPHLRPGAPLRELLASLRQRADGHGLTYQFVRRYRLGATSSAAPHPTIDGPLLAVVVRGAAAKAATVSDDLAAQLDGDFAVVTDAPAGTLAGLEGDHLVVHFDQDAVAAISSTGARYAVVLDADTRVSPEWIAALRRHVEEAPGRVIVSGCADGGLEGPALAPATMELLGVVPSGAFVPAAYFIPVAALTLGGVGQLGPSPSDLAVAVARSVMWCGRFDAPEVTVAASAYVAMDALLSDVVVALDAEPIVHAPGALAPTVALAKRVADLDDARAVLQLQLDQLQHRHEQHVAAQEEELRRLHGVIARQSTPWGALAFAAGRWTKALARRILPRRLRDRRNR